MLKLHFISPPIEIPTATGIQFNSINYWSKLKTVTLYILTVQLILTVFVNHTVSLPDISS